MKEVKNTTVKLRLKSSSRCKGEIKSIFSFAKKYHTPHKEILGHLYSRVYDQSKYKTLPLYERQHINGFAEAYFEMMYDHLEFAYWYDGKFTLTLKYDEGFKQELIEKSNHVYIGSQDEY